VTGFDPEAPGGAAHAEQAAAWLHDALGVQLPDGLLGLALTHRSFAYENGGLPTNERLEFLGDSVLGLVVTDELYRSQPDLPEGQLAKLRASVVNMTSLARVARRLGKGGIGPHLLLGRGEETTGGRDKDSILADAFEALCGALYIDGGLDAVRDKVMPLFEARIAALPEPATLKDAKTFTASVVLAGTVYGTGTGRTKKAAEQEAAEAAWRSLSES
jgi:ribonuclease-3